MVLQMLLRKCFCGPGSRNSCLPSPTEQIQYRTKITVTMKCHQDMQLSFNFKYTLSIRTEKTKHLCGEHPEDQSKNAHRAVLRPGNRTDVRRPHLTNDPHLKHSSEGHGWSSFFHEIRNQFQLVPWTLPVQFCKCDWQSLLGRKLRSHNGQS